MADKEIKDKLENLRNQIHYHNYRYHTLDDPVITDGEFDQLLSQLRQLEEKYPELITPDSPTQRAGSKALDSFSKVTHPAFILSLANAFGSEDVYDWFKRILKLDERVNSTDFVIEPKIDGLTVVLHYEKGVFVLGATRGNGEVGEDITENLRTIPTIPLRIPTDNSIQPPDLMIVRGEVYITKKDFEALNKSLQTKGEKTYLNPRNTAAGSLRQIDPKQTAKRPLRILVYQIIDSSLPSISTQWQALELLKTYGFPISDHNLRAKDIEKAVQICEDNASERQKWVFEADGMVIKVNDLNLYKELGVVGKDPRGAIAYKYPTQEVTTILKDVVTNVGRTGVLTPQAILTPVPIGGVVVRQATLHNFDFITEKDIRIGDRVLVKRAGEVIPYIIGPIIDARTGVEKIINPPQTCPSCGQPVTKIDVEVAYYCTNTNCPAQLLRNMEHFVSSSGMDIVGLGPQILRQLADNNLIKEITDLYKLKKEDLLKLEGFAEKKADNLLESIEASKKQPLERLIFALGIPSIGESASFELSQRYRDLDELSKANDMELQAIEGFGPNMVNSIINWFSSFKNKNTIENFKNLGIWPKNEKIHTLTDKTKTLTGLTFVITGTLPNLTRNEISELIVINGGKISSSVSKNTDFLILGENAGSKLNKAKQFNTKILDEKGFLKLIAVEDM